MLFVHKGCLHQQLSVEIFHKNVSQRFSERSYLCRCYFVKHTEKKLYPTNYSFKLVIENLGNGNYFQIIFTVF